LPAPDELTDQVREFAAELSDLLNNTVTAGVRLSGAITPNGDVGFIGRNVSKTQFVSDPFTLRRQSGGPRLSLAVQFQLSLDDERMYLAVGRSVFQLLDDVGLELLHYDYERDKDGYPEAHVQVDAQSAAWSAVLEKAGRDGTSIKHLHLPVGGRRYRPCLEDLIECLIVERLVPGHPNWKDAVRVGRDRFLARQLKAAIRRDPRTAAEALRAAGFSVTDPS
jgi:hypothetical protein